MDILLEQGWSEIDSTLVKSYQLKDFNSAVLFVNRIAKSAEKMNHHPDISIYSYNNVRVILTTHSKGKITEKDIRLAKKIDSLF